MPISTGQSEREKQAIFVERLQQLWRKVRGELMETYGMDRDKFTAIEVFALRSLAIELSNEMEAEKAEVVKPAKKRKPLTR